MTQTKLFKLLQKTITTLMCFWLLSTQMPINVVFADEINTEKNIVEDINEDEINNVDNEEEDQIIIEEDVETVNKEEDEIVDNEIIEEVETETSINQELLDRVNTLLNTDITSITDIDELTNVYDNTNNIIDEYNESSEQANIDYESLLSFKYDVTKLLIDKHIESLPSEEEINTFTDVQNQIAPTRKLVRTTIPSLIDELNEIDQTNYNNNYASLLSDITTLLANRQKQIMNGEAVGTTRTWNNITWTEWTSTTDLPTSGAYYLNVNDKVSYSGKRVLTGNLYLDLNGKTIEFTGKNQQSAFDVTNGNDFYLYDSAGGGKIQRGTNASYHRAVWISDSNSIFYMYGGTITGFKNTGQDGGAVNVNSGTFNMKGGTISNNEANNGGGVFVGGGTFNFEGGTISDNKAKWGGGIYSTATTNLKGGTISYNTATTQGGGAFINSGGSITMSGGSISYNECTANDGGGVYVAKGTFNFNGGTISYNSSSWGAGVYCGDSGGNSGTFNLNGGTIGDTSRGSAIWKNKGTCSITKGIISTSATFGYVDIPTTTSKITFDQQSGSGGTGSTSLSWKTTTTITPPTRTGYSFGGYYTGTNGTGTKYFNTNGTMPIYWDRVNYPTTLYAYWIPNSYNVTFDQQSGSNGSTRVTVSYNSAMPSITLPTRLGFVFDGYYTGTNRSGDKYYNADGSSAHVWDKTSATTLYANWVDPVSKYAAKVNSNITNAYYDGEESYFTTFEEAMMAIKTNNLSNVTVTLLKNVTLTTHFNASNSYFDELTIDLNGNKITTPDSWFIRNQDFTKEGSLTIKNGTVVINANSGYHVFGGAGKTITVYSKDVNYYAKEGVNSSTLFLGNCIATFDGGFIDPNLTIANQYYNYLYTEVLLENVCYPGENFIYKKVDGSEKESKITISGGKYKFNPKEKGANIANGYVVAGITESNVSDPEARYSSVYNCEVVPGGLFTIIDNGGTVSAALPTQYETGKGITLPAMSKTGYEFAGWEASSGTISNNVFTNTSSGPVTLTAKFAANTNTAYKVEHYKQNGDCSTYPTTATETENKTGTTGENVTPGVKTYTGYTSPSAETKAILADGSLVFNYFYTRNKYSIKYDGNGSTSGSMSNSEHIYDVAKALTNNSYVKQHTVTYNANNGTCDKASDVANYTFAGWNTSANGNGTSYTNSQSVTNLSFTDGDVVTLYAQWNAGSVTLPSASRVGYEFDGWYDAETNGNKIGDAGSTYTPTIDITLYARWEISTSVINFDKQGGTGGSDSVTATYGSDMSLITSPTKEGFVFVGYFDAEEGGTQYYNADGSSAKNWDKTSDTTLYAHWNEIIPIPLPNYDLYYNSKRIPGVQPSPYYDLENGSAINVGTYTATVTPKDGYVWPDGTADPINISYTINKKYINSVASRIILKEIEDYAGKPIEPEVEKVITYDGIVLSPSDYTVTYSNNTMSDGYNGSQQALVHVTAKEDSNFEGTITREFLINKALYTITFETFGGNVIEDINVYYGSHVSYSDLPTPSKNGYKNPSGAVWYKDSECSTGNEWTYENDVVTSNITLYCKWVPVEYMISYDLDNGIANNPTTYTIETDSFTLNNPTKEGFVFSGWTGTDLLEKTTTVTIENGSCGNKEYVANYDKKIDVPSAIEGLIYNDTEQIGVEVGEGYTLTNNTATEAGNHTAIASLEDGYVWSDGTYEAKQIVFTIKNNRFEVSFDVLGSGTTGLSEGSIVESIEPIIVKLGETYGNMIKPTYVGYTFIGWFLGDIEITEESTVELTDNVTLVAHWNKIDALVKIASEDILANAIGYDGTYSYFDTFIKAVNSASENDELIIVKNINNNSNYTQVDKSLKINVDIYSFDNSYFSIKNDKTLTLTGNGGTLSGNILSSSSDANIIIDGDLTVSATISTQGNVQLKNGTVSGYFSVSGSTRITGGVVLSSLSLISDDTIITGGSFKKSNKDYVTWNNRMDKNQYKLVLNEETDLYDVIELENVVSIGDIKYKTLATALQAAQDGDVLVLLNDIGGTEESGNFVFDKKISLDLNNHSITYNSGSRININNDVTINGEGTINCWVNVNDGTVTINDATLTKDVYIGEDSKEVVLILNNVQNGDNSGYFFVKGKAEINVVDGKIRNLYARTNDLSKVKFNLSGNVYFEQIDFNNIPKENITITGGSYPYDVTQWLRDCYIATDTGHNSRHIVSEYVEASIDATKYKSFLEAYNAAQDGDTIKIERAIDFARQLEDPSFVNPIRKRLALNKAITIDTNGHRMSYDQANSYYRVIRILKDIEFTGNGFVDANFQIDEGGTLTITGGTFEKTIAKHGGDLVLINGIFYRNDKVDPDDVYQANEPIIEYKTIEEYKQVMSECVAKDISHIRHVADDGEGYLVVEPHNFVNHYCDTVIDGNECGAIDKEHVVAEILNSNGSVIEQYFGFKEAIDAATAGQTVKLVKDYDETQDITINKNITIDLNGYTLGHLQVAGNINKEIYINSNVKFDGEGNIYLGVNVNNNGTLEVPSGNDKLYFWNLVGTSGSGKLNINSGNYFGGEGIRVYSNVTINYVDDANVGVHGGSLTINNGHFGSINTYDNKTATIKGGTFVNVIANSGTINIQGGSFSNIISGNVKIYGGKFVNEPNNSYIASGYIVTEINETEFFNNKDNNLRYEVVKGYEVTLDNKDATTPGTTKVVVAHNGTMPNITIPEKTGYAFDGYYDDLTNGTKYYNANGTSAHVWDKESDATLYAKWIKKVTIPTAITGLTYNGSEQIGVAEGIGYTLTGHKATDVGTYTAIATLEPGYIWSDNTIEDKNITFTISPLSISNAEIKLDEYDKYYCGTSIIPNIISVKVGDITLDSNDYELTYSNNDFTETVDDSYDEKDAVVKVEAINSNFTGSKEATYKIQRKAYSITLKLNGGHFESSEELPTTKLYGKPITIEHCPIKEGYSFVDYVDQEDNHYSVGDQIDVNKDLQLKANWEIDETQWVAKVNNDISGYDNKNIVDGITYTYFNDLQTAINNANGYTVTSNGYTVTLLNNVTLTGNALEIAAESEVTLDLNQKIIDANYLSNIFKVFGKLTIDDSSATTDNNGNYVAGKLINGKFKEIPYKNGELYACGNAIYVVNAELIINQGIIENCKTDESLTEDEYIGARTGVIFGSSATITINGGLITNCSAGVGGAIFADYSNVTIAGGTIENCKALEQDGQGAIKVYGNPAQSNHEASLTITGGTIRNCTAPAESVGSVIYVSETAVANISGGTIIGAKGIEGDNFVKVHDQNNNYITGGWFSAPITSAADYHCVGPVSDAVDTDAPYTVTNKHYTITYKIKGESEDSYQEVYAPQGYSVKTTLKEDPTKEAYTFDGWYLNEDYTGNKYSGVTEYEINKDITFYAKWDVDTTSEKWVAKVDKVKDNTTGVLSLDGLYYFDDLPTAIENAAENLTNDEAQNSTVTLLKDVELVGPIQQVPNNVIIDLNNKKISSATYTYNSVSDAIKDTARIFYQVENSFSIKNGTLENRALCGYAIFTDCKHVKAYDINYTYTQHDDPSYTDPAQIAAFYTTLEIYGGSVEGNYVLTWTTSEETITINNSDKNKFFYKCTNYVKGGSPSITINGGLYKTLPLSTYVNDEHVVIDTVGDDKTNGYNYEVVEGGKITFTLNEGTLPSDYSNPAIYTKELGISLPTPTRNEYVFDGWYTNSDLKTSVTNTTSFGQGETGPKTLYAKWITVIEAAVAKIESNSRLTNAVGFENDYSYYDTLANAIKDATSTETKITLLKDIAEHDLTISANQNVTLDLNRKTIDAENKGRLFVINGSLTINDLTATGDETNGTYVAGRLINGRSTGSGTVGTDDSELGNAIFVKGENAALNINDGIIENCTMIAGKGSGNGTIYATGKNSEVRFNGGVIRNCTTLKGGAFYIAGSYFKMTGGAIINCKSTYVESQTEGAGAINLFCNTSLITGGLIRGCEAAGKCGGIQIKIAKLTITGGVFENCTGGDLTRGQLIDVINDEQNRYLLVDKSTGIRGSSLEITGGTFVGADNAKTNDLIHISSNDENKITGGWYSGDITPNENYGVVGPINDAPDARAPYTVTNNFYTITYDSNGGNAIDPKKIYSLSGHSAKTKIINDVPTKQGYKFSSWNTESNGTGTRYVADDVITLTGDIILYAQWEEDVVTVYLHSKANISGKDIGAVGQLIRPEKITKNVSVNIEAIEDIDSIYRFDHWEIDGKNVGNNLTLSYAFTKDVTDVYAVFRYELSNGIKVHVESERPFTMKVKEKQNWLLWTYNVDATYVVENDVNGVYDKIINVVPGSQVELIYANTNNDFVAWTSEKGVVRFKKPTYLMNAVYVEQDIRLQAKEEIESKHYVKFVNNDDQILKTCEVESLEELKSAIPNAPGRLGYKFVDWSINDILLSELTYDQLQEIFKESDVIEIRAKFEKLPDKYKVIANTVIGGVSSQFNVDTDEYALGDVVYLSAPKVEDYVFAYWTIDDEIVSYNEKYEHRVLGNITISANYQKEVVEKQVTLTASVAAGGSQGNEKIAFTVTRSVPEDMNSDGKHKYSVVENGILYSSKALWTSNYSSDFAREAKFKFDNVDKYGNVKLTNITKVANSSNSYNGNMTGSFATKSDLNKVFYIRGYIIVECDNGTTSGTMKTIYTDLYKVTYNTIGDPIITTVTNN